MKKRKGLEGNWSQHVLWSNYIPPNVSFEFNYCNPSALLEKKIGIIEHTFHEINFVWGILSICNNFRKYTDRNDHIDSIQKHMTWCLYVCILHRKSNHYFIIGIGHKIIIDYVY